jgi:hypothetical protein
MPDIAATVAKLAEANFFFCKLSQSQGQVVVDPEPEAFGYYLSAFLSAACSVRDVLRTEQPRRRKNAYREWFKMWEVSLSKSDLSLWQSVYSQRVATVHLTGVTMGHRLEAMSHTEFMLAASREGVQFQHFSSPPGTPAPKYTRAIRVLNLNGSNVDVVQACGKYLEIAAGLVQSYRGHFGNQAAT